MNTTLPAHRSVNRIMTLVSLALMPALLAYTWIFGWGVVLNVLLASLTAVAAEALFLKLRGKPFSAPLGDGSAVLTALLLCMALPPLLPWWVVVIGTLAAIVLGKQLYGGMGFNPFNPAMVGYVVLLISFPREMSMWLAPFGGEQPLGLADVLRYVFIDQLPTPVVVSGATPQVEAASGIDAYTMATPLDSMKTGLGLEHTVGEIMAWPMFGYLGGSGWEIINALILLGGLWMLYARLITWHAPVAMLGSLFLIAAIFHLIDPQAYANPLFHVVTGGALLGAFFIATDPVSGATSLRGQLIFGAGVGLLTYIIRTWGGYPDGVAFSILLMNMAAPTIDYYTRPRVFGHKGG